MSLVAWLMLVNVSFIAPIDLLGHLKKSAYCRAGC